MISVIIILYNSKKYISKCIDAIENNFSNSNDYEIIFYNNNPKDDYSKIIKKPYVVETSKVNLGYSKALNYCISKCSSEYILCLNPDTILYNNAISSLMQVFDKKDNVGVVGAKVLNPSLDLQLSSRRKFPSISTIMLKFAHTLSITENNTYNYISVNEDMLQEVDSISGSCMLFTKKVYDKLNGFDERFFLYFEDTDYCIRLKNNNYKVLYCPEARLIHYKRGSASKKNKFFILFNFYFSMTKFILKYSQKYKSLYLIILITIIVILKICQNIY